MKTKEEIEKFATEQYLKRIYDFETNDFSDGVFVGYKKCQEETFTREELIQCMSKATRWDTFNENEPEYKMDMDEFFDYIIKQIKK